MQMKVLSRKLKTFNLVGAGMHQIIIEKTLNHSKSRIFTKLLHLPHYLQFHLIIFNNVFRSILTSIMTNYPSFSTQNTCLDSTNQLDSCIELKPYQCLDKYQHKIFIPLKLQMVLGYVSLINIFNNNLTLAIIIETHHETLNESKITLYFWLRTCWEFLPW